MEYLFTVLMAILIALVIIIFELRHLATLLAQRLGGEGLAKADGSPTINVNLGNMVSSPRPRRERSEKKSLPAAKAEDAPSQALPPEPEPEPEPEPPPPPPPKPYVSPRPPGSGLGVVKCPKCQAENSTYRTECFSCGAALR